MTAHTQFRKGQKVVVFFKDKIKQIIGKFIAVNSRGILLNIDGSNYYYPIRDIRQISIWRQK